MAVKEFLMQCTNPKLFLSNMQKMSHSEKLNLHCSENIQRELAGKKENEMLSHIVSDVNTNS